MGLLGGVFNDGGAMGQGGGQHDVHGGAHRGDVHIDRGALHIALLCRGTDQAAPNVHIGAHGGKAFDMLVNGAVAQVAAAGWGHLGAAEPGEEDADEIVAGANLPGRFIRDGLVSHMRAIDVHRGAVHRPHVGAQILEDVEHQGHIADLGKILNAADPVHQQGGGDDGNGGILGAADLDLTMKRLSAGNHIFCQIHNPLCSRRPFGRKSTVLLSRWGTKR